MTHRHRSRSSWEFDRGYSGPVAQPENPAAHGNVCRHQTCNCGATRRVNINGGHREAGEWIEVTP